MAACSGAACKTDQKEDDKTLDMHFETTAIHVTDLDKSKKFYKENFGMCVRFSKTDEMAHPEKQDKKVKVKMCLLDTPRNQKQPGPKIEGHLLLMCPEGSDKDPKYKLNQCTTEDRQFGGFAFTCDDMKTSCEKLEKNGVKFFKDKKFGDKPGVMGGKGAKCMDPDGTPIILSARPKAGVIKREWNMCQTIMRCKDADKFQKLMEDLGMACTISNGDGEKMGFKFRWMIPDEPEMVAKWKKMCKTGKLPGAFSDYPDREEMYTLGNYHTNVEIISNKDQKIDVRLYDPMLGFLCNDLKLAKNHCEKKLGLKIIWADKDSFVVQDPDGGAITVTEFNPPKM